MGPFWRHAGCPRFASKSGKIMDDVSSPDGALFRTLTAKKAPTFRHRHRPPPEGLNFDQNPGNPQPISAERGPFWRHMECPRFSSKSEKIAGDVSSIEVSIFRTLIANKYFHFRHHSRPPHRGPYFTRNFGNPHPRLSNK